MKVKNLLLVGALMMAALSSCKKEEDNNPEPTFEEIATSQMWVKSSWGVRYNTHNPDDTAAGYTDYMEACDSAVLWEFKANGIANQYLDYECRDYNRGLFGGSVNWEFTASENWLRFYVSSVNSSGYNVKHFSKDAIELYAIGDGLGIGGVSQVEIIKLIPN